MTDYGHELEFGCSLIPEAGDPHGVPETARLADRLGYDLLAVQDHPYQPPHLDALALLGVILAQTDHIRVFQDVGNLPLRPPAHSTCSATGSSKSGWAPVAFWTPPSRWVRRLEPRDRASRRSRRRS
jgi:Luciferase-like monooxygenase